MLPKILLPVQHSGEEYSTYHQPLEVPLVHMKQTPLRMAIYSFSHVQLLADVGTTLTDVHSHDEVPPGLIKIL